MDLRTAIQRFSAESAEFAPTLEAEARSVPFGDRRRKDFRKTLYAVSTDMPIFVAIPIFFQGTYP
jgi:hypothetical protein